MRTSTSEIIFESEIGERSPAFLNDHRIYGTAVFSAVAYLEMAVTAAAEALKIDEPALEEVLIRHPLYVPEHGSRLLQLVVSPVAPGAFQVSSSGTNASENNSTSWTIHASGKYSGYSESTSDPILPSELQARCPVEVSTERMYSKLRVLGLELGPKFRGVEQLWRGEGEAVARLRLPDGLQETSGSYRVHPVLLDSCIQAIGALVDAEERQEEGVFLPFSIDRFHCKRHPGGEVWGHLVYRQGDHPNPEIVKVDVRMLDAQGRTIVHFEGLNLKHAPRIALLGAAGKALDDSLYSVSWTPRPRLRIAHPAAPSMAAPIETGASLAKYFAKLNTQRGMESYRDLPADFDRLSAAYVVEALQDLAGIFEAGRVLPEFPDVKEQHRQLLSRLLKILTEEGVLGRANTAWTVLRVPAIPSSDELWNEVSSKYPDARGEMSLLGRCGRELARILRGEADPLQILFPGGSMADLEALYQESPFARILNETVAEAFHKLIENVTADRLIRVIQIGAGTGSTSSYVLSRLPADRTEYVFTDVSPLFIGHAQQKFRRFPFVRYQLLDIEQNLWRRVFSKAGLTSS